MEKNRKTVFVAMSGGVDSSVAAALLKKAGFAAFDVVGVFMRNWHKDMASEGVVYCPWEEDQESARAAAAALGIPLYTWDFSKEYKARVVDYMIEGYRRGETPNPDVMCNKEIKFGLFLEKARKLGADYIATGHYARVVANRKSQIADSKESEPFAIRHKLYAGIDKNKDQSYFLWTLSQEVLSRTLFPIGEYRKTEVRKMAHAFGLPNAERKDSQGLCFVGKVDVREFLAQWLPPREGEVLTPAGEVIGTHQGTHFYTVGQRHGIGIGGGTPYFVAKKDVSKNVLVVAPKEDPVLYQKEMEIRDILWISGKPPLGTLQCHARIRYRQPLARCTITRNNTNSRMLRVIFDEPQRAVTPGQSIVFYDGEEVLGGAVLS